MGKILFFIISMSLLFFYQNCSQGFEIAEPIDLSSQCVQPNGKTSLKSAQLKSVIRKPFLKTKVKLLKETVPSIAHYTLLVDYAECSSLQNTPLKNLRILDLEKEQLNNYRPKSIWAYNIELTDVELSELKSEISDISCIIGLEEAPSRFEHLAFNVNDSLYPQQEHLQDSQAGSMGFQRAVEYIHSKLGTQSPSRPVVVAQIGRGVDGTHPDLVQSMWRGPNNLYGYNLDFPSLQPRETPRCSGTCTQIDVDYFVGHDTHIAGLIAATTNNSIGIAGINLNNTQIMAVKIAEGSATYTSLVNGINWAADNGADVINLSIGFFDGGSAIQVALSSAIAKGVFISMAAGNFGNTDIIIPANYGKSLSGAITVGSVDSDNGLKSCFSSYGSSFVEIGATGARSGPDTTCVNDLEFIDIHGLLSTGLRATLNFYPNYPPSVQQVYRRIAGTSMSAPMVAAAGAWIIAIHRLQNKADPSPQEIESIILNSADRVPELNNFFENGRRLNLYNIATGMLEPPPPPPTTTTTTLPTNTDPNEPPTVPDNCEDFN